VATSASVASSDVSIRGIKVSGLDCQEQGVQIGLLGTIN